MQPMYIIKHIQPIYMPGTVFGISNAAFNNYIIHSCSYNIMHLYGTIWYIASSFWPKIGQNTTDHNIWKCDHVIVEKLATNGKWH